MAYTLSEMSKKHLAKENTGSRYAYAYGMLYAAIDSNAWTLDELREMANAIEQELVK